MTMFLGLENTILALILCFEVTLPVSCQLEYIFNIKYIFQITIFEMVKSYFMFNHFITAVF